jgi:FimV-like protein
MRHFVVAMGIVSLAFALTSVGGAADSKAAADTRKKLEVKVTEPVEYKDEMLREILKGLSKYAEDAGFTPLLIKYDTGVSMNQRISFSAPKDKTVAELLDGVLGKQSLGYVIISAGPDSKDKDLKRYDGGLLIKANSKERGDPIDDKSAKTKPKAEIKDKVAAKDKEPTKDKAPAPESKEKDASTKLNLIKTLIDDGKKEKAKERLEELIKQYPGTKAAEEAEALLKKLAE